MRSKTEILSMAAAVEQPLRRLVESSAYAEGYYIDEVEELQEWVDDLKQAAESQENYSFSFAVLTWLQNRKSELDEYESSA